MKNKIVVLKLKFYELQRGDIVFSYDNSNIYRIDKIGRTFFHNHFFVKRINANGIKDTLFCFENDLPRKVLRGIEVKE